MKTAGLEGLTTRRAVMGIAAYAGLWFFTPPAEPRWPLCGFHWLTGRPCPLCGLTRAMFALAKGHVAQAMHFNALSPLAFIMLLSLLWEAPAFSAVRGRLWSGGLAAFALYGVYRFA